MKNIDDVKSFWENNPLWTGESKFEAGTREFFEEHKRVYINDCFAGQFDENTLPNHIVNKTMNSNKVLDLGCGPGFWTIQLAERGFNNIIAADLTENAIALTKKRTQIYGFQNIECILQNAEQLTLKTGEFDHVNCQGVIHHSPNTVRCLEEISRVLKEGGTACISVYYKNWFLRNWGKFAWLGKIMNKLGAGLNGRGREDIFAYSDVNEIVRLYDGIDNPVGKAYSKQELIEMLEPYFNIEKMYLHFFPARAFPFNIPKSLHLFLDKHFGFMIYANLTRK